MFFLLINFLSKRLGKEVYVNGKFNINLLMSIKDIVADFILLAGLHLHSPWKCFSV